MIKSRILIGASAFILAISGAFITQAQLGSVAASNKVYDETLYRPSDCVAFSCTNAGSVSCSTYVLDDCITPEINNLKHN
jgi:hypothetical protein